MRAPVPGVIRSQADLEASTHPYPIFAGSDAWFRLWCSHCRTFGLIRATLQAAIADRITHERRHR